MKKAVWTFILYVSLSCSALATDAVPKSRITFQGGNGTSPEYAILIVGAKNADEAIASERTWIDEHFPRSIPHAQRLFMMNNHTYDEMIVTTPDGAIHNVFFDLTAYDWNHEK